MQERGEPSKRGLEGSRNRMIGKSERNRTMVI